MNMPDLVGAELWYCPACYDVYVYTAEYDGPRAGQRCRGCRKLLLVMDEPTRRILPWKHSLGQMGQRRDN